MLEGRSKKVRVRNIDYALTGSVNIEGGKAISFRLEPNKWTEVDDAVYAMLKSKYGESRYSDAPNSLPDASDNYYGHAGQTRAELVNGQYLIEFSS